MNISISKELAHAVENVAADLAEQKLGYTVSVSREDLTVIVNDLVEAAHETSKRENESLNSMFMRFIVG